MTFYTNNNRDSTILVEGILRFLLMRNILTFCIPYGFLDQWLLYAYIKARS